MITSRVYEEEVSKFLKIKSSVLGVLEILVGVVALGCVLLNELSPIIVAPVLYVLTGVLTVLAACTRNLCLVRTSQTFSFIIIFVITFSSCFGLLIWLRNVTGIVLMVSDILVLVFSVVVAASSCSCCCRPKSRSVEVSYVSTGVPANSVGLVNQSDPSASVYIVPSAPPPYYCPTTSAPPPYYSRVSTASPTYYNSVPTSPPPPYELS